MKSIAIFLVVGLSLFHNGNCVHHEILTCVVEAVKNSPNLLEELRDLACMLKEIKATEDTAILEAFIDKVKAFLEKSCTKEELTVLGIQLDKTVNGVSETAKKLADSLQPTLDKLGLNKPILDILCKIKKALADSECLKNAVEYTADVVKELTSALKAFKCDKLTVEGLIHLLNQITCIPTEVLEEILEDLSLAKWSKKCEQLLKDWVIKAILDLLDDPKLADDLNNVLCKVEKVVNKVVDKKVKKLVYNVVKL